MLPGFDEIRNFRNGVRPEMCIIKTYITIFFKLDVLTSFRFVFDCISWSLKENSWIFNGNDNTSTNSEWSDFRVMISNDSRLQECHVSCCILFETIMYILFYKEPKLHTWHFKVTGEKKKVISIYTLWKMNSCKSF